MSKPRIEGETWFRSIHDTWENTAGYRTDIAHRVLHRSDLRYAAFVLDDKRTIVVQMTD